MSWCGRLLLNRHVASDCFLGPPSVAVTTAATMDDDVDESAGRKRPLWEHLDSQSDDEKDSMGSAGCPKNAKVPKADPDDEPELHDDSAPSVLKWPELLRQIFGPIIQKLGEQTHTFMLETVCTGTGAPLCALADSWGRKRLVQTCP